MQSIQQLVASGVPVHQACPMLSLSLQYYHHFKKAFKRADELEKNGIFMHYKCNSGARKLHPGHPSILAAIRDDLSQLFVKQERKEFKQACA